MPRSPKAAIVLLVPVLALGGLEAGLRAAGAGAGYWEGMLPPTVMADPDLRVRLRPSSRMASRESGLIVVSRHGTRGDDFDVPKPPGRFRIVAAGDSVTFGWGVEGSEAFPAVLERSLEARGDVDVVNAGQPSHTSWQGLLALRRDLLPFGPDVVLFAFGHNDQFQGAFSEREDEAAWPRARRRVQGWLRRSRIYTVLTLLLKGRHPAPPAAAMAGPGAPGGRHVPRSTPEEFAENLAAAHEACLAAGAAFVLVTQPRRSREPTRYAEVVRQVAVERRIPVVDLESAFAALPPGGLFVDNVHPSAAGHRVFAAEIERVLDGAALLPLRSVP